jgi:non-ribosomal peptide synthetase component F
MTADSGAINGSTLSELLSAKVAATPSAVAYRTFRLGLWEPTTWVQLSAQVSTTATGLSSVGVTNGSSVVVAADNSPAWVVAALACAHLGAQIVTVAPEVSFEAMKDVLVLVQPRAAIAGDEEQFDKVTDADPQLTVVVLDTRGVRSLDNPGRDDAARRMTIGQLRERPSSPVGQSVGTGDSVALVHRGHPSTHRELIEAGRSLASTLAATSSDRLHSQRNLADPQEFVASVVLPLLVGSEVSFGSVGSVGLLVREMGMVQPTLVHGSPAWLSAVSADIADRSGKTRLLRKAALSAGWKPKAPLSTQQKPSIPKTRLFGALTAIATFLLLVVSASWKGGYRMLAVMALLAIIALLMVFTGASVVDPLRRRYGVQRVRAVFADEAFASLPAASTLGALAIPLVTSPKMFASESPQKGLA